MHSAGMAYIGLGVVHDDGRRGVVDDYDVERALVCWGTLKNGQRQQQWVPWAVLRFENGDAAQFSEAVRRRAGGGR